MARAQCLRNQPWGICVQIQIRPSGSKLCVEDSRLDWTKIKTEWPFGVNITKTIILVAAASWQGRKKDKCDYLRSTEGAKPF